MLVDDWQDRSRGERELVAALEAGGSALTAAGDDDQAIGRARGAGAAGPASASPRSARTRAIVALRAELPLPPARARRPPHAVRRARSRRASARTLRGAAGGEVRFWRAANERAQAQQVAAELERLIAARGRRAGALRGARRLARRGGPDGRRRARPSAPCRAACSAPRRSSSAPRSATCSPGCGCSSTRATPPAVVRALARPPIELPSADIARCVQIARRRRIDMVGGARSPRPSRRSSRPRRASASSSSSRSSARRAAALDGHARRPLRAPPDRAARPAPPPALHARAPTSSSGCSTSRAWASSPATSAAASRRRRRPRVRRATSRSLAEAGLGEEEALAPAPARAVVGDAASRRPAGSEFDHVFVLGLHAGRAPGARARGLAPIADELAPTALPEQPPRRARAAPAVRRDDARRARRSCSPTPRPRRAAPSARPRRSPRRPALALGRASGSTREEELFGPAEALHSMFRERRDELLAGVARLGTRLGELRFDTDLDVAHGVVRYLELVKLAALMQRREHEPLDDALEDVNARLAAAVDAAAARGARRPRRSTSCCSAPAATRACARRRWRRARSRRSRRSCRAAARASCSRPPTSRPTCTCPLRYKFARVLRIPREPTLNQRFGILVHQVLERFHGSGGGGTDDDAARCSTAGWRRGGFSRLRRGAPAAREGARRAAALPRAARRATAASRAGSSARFNFPLGRHHIRGRVDRVDALAGGGYELIDYKTGPAQARRAAARRRPARALRGRRARGLAARGDRAHLLLRARRRARAARRRRRRARLDRGAVARGRRRDPRAGLRADALARGLRDVRVPDRLPGRRASRAGRVHAPVARGPAHAPIRAGRAPHRGTACTDRLRLLAALAAALAQEALELAREAVARGDVLASRCCARPRRAARGARRRPGRRGRSGPRGRPGARSRRRRSRARSRRPRRRRGPRGGAAAPAPPSGWAPRRRSGGRSPTGSRRGCRASAHAACEHADDPGRALVAGRAQAEPLAQRRVGARAADVDREAVRDVGEQRAERDDELDAERLGEVGDHRA